MAWYSILPPQLVFLESWAARIFIFLGLITIGPWLGLIVFDFVLYICRMFMYEFPVVGGRARGRQRPRAPSLHETSTGQPRTFGLRGVETGGRAPSRASTADEDTAAKENIDPSDQGELKRRNVQDASG